MPHVALFTRAWIEMENLATIIRSSKVALFTRAWIEIRPAFIAFCISTSRPLHEGVD